MRALFTSATGMAAQQSKMDDIANNLANVNTVAFKRAREDFQDLFYQRLRATGIASNNGGVTPVGVEIGHGVKLAAIEKMFTQGTFTETKNELDLAIEGQGFFQLETTDGQTVYSRAGNFKPGFAIPQDTVSLVISRDGVVSAVQAYQTEPTQLGTIELARFINPGGLEALGRNQYKATETSGQPLIASPSQEGMGTLVQGFLESSNVDVAEEMVQMIIAQRSYETSSKVMTAADQIMQYTNNLVR